MAARSVQRSTISRTVAWPCGASIRRRQDGGPSAYGAIRRSRCSNRPAPACSGRPSTDRTLLAEPDSAGRRRLHAPSRPAHRPEFPSRWPRAAGLGVRTFTRSAFQSFQSSRSVASPTRRQLWPGHRRAQRHHVAPAVLVPVDTATAALARIADGDAPCERPLRAAACSQTSARRRPGPRRRAACLRGKTRTGGAARPSLSAPGGAAERASTACTAQARRMQPNGLHGAHAPVFSSARCSERLSGSSLRDSSKNLRASSFLPVTHSTSRDVRGDLGVLLQGEGATQFHQRLVVAAQPIQDPAVAVDDRGADPARPRGRDRSVPALPGSAWCGRPACSPARSARRRCPDR